MKRVLFVDDEPFVLKVIERKFKKTNIKCYFTSHVDEAVDILKDKEIDVLVTDIQMPEHNGIEFSKIVSEISPRTVRIILSGSSRVASIIEAINEGHVYKYIEKPWTIDDKAIELIEEAIQRSRKFVQDEPKELTIPVEELNKFQGIEHWVLVDTLNKMVHKNSDYPFTNDFEGREFIKVRSNIGELKLYSVE